MTREYLVEPLSTGLFSGSLDPRKLQNFLNKYGKQGWRFVRSIHETYTVFIFFKREAHFVIFERELH